MVEPLVAGPAAGLVSAVVDLPLVAGGLVLELEHVAEPEPEAAGLASA